jgi:hypothetical protein
MNRGKEEDKLDGFRVNHKKWFDETIKSNGINRVKSFQADVSEFDFKETKLISFCLIDVDLYIPIKAALDKVYPLMAKGGIIVVDDCKQNNLFDGAYKAYIEFIETHQLPKKIILDKLGIIEINKLSIFINSLASSIEQNFRWEVVTNKKLSKAIAFSLVKIGSAFYQSLMMSVLPKPSNLSKKWWK